MALDSIPNNLPLQLTSFIGRQKEIEEVEKILKCFAFLYQIDHQYKLAAKLFGAAEVLREQTKSQMIQSELEEYDRYVALLRQNIGSDDLAKSWRIGRRLNMDDAVEWVLEN